MTDICVVILTGHEERHIKRCLARLAPLAPRQVVVVESQKGDQTHDLAIATANALGWLVHDYLKNDQSPAASHQPPTTTLITAWHDWPGLQSIQFNWALDALCANETLEVKSETSGAGSETCSAGWILRLDADEYLTDDGIAWLKTNFDAAQPVSSAVPNCVNALAFILERKFCGGVIRHGTNGIPMVRMFRRGKGRYAETAMDERIEVIGAGESVLRVPVVFYDDSLMPMEEWRTKHRRYARREAQQAVASMKSGQWVDPRKAGYYRLPRYFRAFLYFGIRYFLKLGVLDGYAGWMWNFWQGLWYRLQVDREIGKLTGK